MRAFRELWVVLLAGIALLYLMSPSLLPDFIPVVGWIDEGIATTILLAALKRWGIDMTGLFEKEEQSSEAPATQTKLPEPPTTQPSEHLIWVNDDSTRRKVRIPKHVLEQALREYEAQQGEYIPRD